MRFYLTDTSATKPPVLTGTNRWFPNGCISPFQLIVYIQKIFFQIIALWGPMFQIYVSEQHWLRWWLRACLPLYGTRANKDLLSSGPLGTHFSELLIQLLASSMMERCLKMSSAKWLFTSNKLVSGWHFSTWWRHQMETFFALVTLSEGNPPVTGGFPSQRLVTWSFGVFFDVRLNNRLSKQWWGR